MDALPDNEDERRVLFLPSSPLLRFPCPSPLLSLSLSLCLSLSLSLSLFASVCLSLFFFFFSRHRAGYRVCAAYAI